jgi:predicted nucleic acid-binding protein
MQRQKVYIETSVISYLAAKQSRDIVVAGQQEITRQWWDYQKEKYNVFISELVISEASAGDILASKMRLQYLENILILGFDEKTLNLSKLLVNSGIIPIKATEDALHISIATVNEMDYLLTWNCKHIANAAINKQLRKLIANNGYEMPILCTPNELLME